MKKYIITLTLLGLCFITHSGDRHTNVKELSKQGYDRHGNLTKAEEIKARLRRKLAEKGATVQEDKPVSLTTMPATRVTNDKGFRSKK